MAQSMTRRHFDALHSSKPVNDKERLAQWLYDAEVVADAREEFNPNFDRARFLAACRVEG